MQLDHMCKLLLWNITNLQRSLTHVALQCNYHIKLLYSPMRSKLSKVLTFLPKLIISLFSKVNNAQIFCNLYACEKFHEYTTCFLRICLKHMSHYQVLNTSLASKGISGDGKQCRHRSTSGKVHNWEITHQNHSRAHRPSPKLEGESSVFTAFAAAS